MYLVVETVWWCNEMVGAPDYALFESNEAAMEYVKQYESSNVSGEYDYEYEIIKMEVQDA